MPAERTATVGDDALQDIRGAIEAGVGRSILVQNGKCRPGDERKAPKPSAVCASIVEAVDYILEKDDRSTS
jgi:ribonucleotide monophosphatase NagD (HAD superfamily)